MDWEVQEKLPSWVTEAIVWMKNGEVRHIRRLAWMNQPYFTDCVHPLQNVLCDEEKVIGWRLG